MQKIKDILTPGDHHKTTTGTTTTSTTPAYGTGTGVGTGTHGAHGAHGAHGTAAHDPNHPSMMQKIKDAITPAGHHNDVPMYTTTAGTTLGAGPNVGNTYGTGVQPSNPGGAYDGVGTGVVGGNTVGTDTSRVSTASTAGSDVRGEPCQVRKFTEIEDRAVLKERVEHYVEHVPVEKQFVIETRAVGEKVNNSGITIESRGVKENIVDAVKGRTCPAPGAIEQAMGAGHGTGVSSATTTYDKCAGGQCS